MSVYISEIVAYGSLKMPEADSLTTGGVIDTTKRVVFTNITPTGALTYVSSANADTATKISVSGRDATGAIQNEVVTLSGQTPVAGSQAFERLLYTAASGAGTGLAGWSFALANPTGTAATGDLMAAAAISGLATHTPQTPFSANHSGTIPPLLYLQAGDGVNVPLGAVIRIVSGTGANQIRYVTQLYAVDTVAVNRDWGTPLDGTSRYTVYVGFCFEILPNPVNALTQIFSTASAQGIGGGTNTYYEKIFVVNNDTATSLTSASVTIQSESGALPGSSALDIAVTKALNDNATTANRQTLPTNADSSALTFTSGAPPQTQNVPSPGNLPSGAAPNAAGAEGVWLRLTLPNGTSPYKGVADLRVTGVST